MRLMLIALLGLAVLSVGCEQETAVEPEGATADEIQALHARVAELDTRIAELEESLAEAEVDENGLLELVGEEVSFSAGVNEVFSDSAIAVGEGDWPFEDRILVVGGEGLSELNLGDIVNVTGEVVVLEQVELEERLGEVPEDLSLQRVTAAVEATEVLRLDR